MNIASKAETVKAVTDHFSLHAIGNSSICGLKEHEKCTFDITPTRLNRLRDLNPAMYQWISDCEQGYTSTMEGIAEGFSLFNPDATPPLISRVVVELHTYCGMTILVTRRKDQKYSLKFFLKFLNHLHKDRTLLASLVGSALIPQSLRQSTDLEGNSVFYSLRDGSAFDDENPHIITMNATFLPNVYFPPLHQWSSCGLGWFFGSHLCCDRMFNTSTPWKEHVCG